MLDVRVGKKKKADAVLQYEERENERERERMGATFQRSLYKMTCQDQVRWPLFRKPPTPS